MTNYRDRFQNNQQRSLGSIDETNKTRLFSNETGRLLVSGSDGKYLTEAESERFVKSFIKQRSRYIPSIDYKDPSTFSYFGSAQKYYIDSIESIYNTYPYDGSKAEKMEWSLTASYLDLYMLEHEYPKSTGHVIFDRASDTITDDANYPTTNNIQYIKFSGGPHKGTIYNSSKNRESNLKLDGSTGNTVEFWLKKTSTSWYSAGRKEVVVDLVTAGHEGDSSNHGRLTVELESPSDANDSPILFTFLSASSTGVDKLRLGSSNVTKASLADGDWHHYAITVMGGDTSTDYKLYVDGTIDSTTTVAHTMGAIDRPITGAIGALATVSGSSGALGAGKLYADLDEFRFWKTARDEKQIGRFWHQPVHGGTDKDHTNASLGLYYKFNEGITTQQVNDKVILDYSGRINNGEFVGWTSSVRSTDSGINLSKKITDPNFSEPADPIINASNALVRDIKESFKSRGNAHDINNLASLVNSVPSHFTLEDTGLFSELLQIMASSFDDLFVKIKNLPKMKDYAYQDFFKEKGQYRDSGNNDFLLGCEGENLFEFTGHHTKPWVNHILDHFGMVSTDVFPSAEMFEIYFNRSEDIAFEHNLEEVKRLILSNIHKSLVHIFKTKGTETSFRNLIRCFGVDERLIKLNSYGKNEEYELLPNPLYETIKQKSVSFEGQNYLGTIHQTTSGSHSAGYITGSSDITPFTLEANVVFPKSIAKDSPDIVRSSIFGMHSVYGDQSSGQVLAWHPTDSGSFQVNFNRRTPTSEDGYFELTSSLALGYTLTSSYIPAVYDNSHWNISVRVGAKSDIDFNIIPATTDSSYLVEFTGYNYDLDVLKNTFHLTASISRNAYETISIQNKGVFVGSHKTNFSGSHLVDSDVRVLGFNAWKDALTESELREHAQNPATYGRSNPQNVSNFDAGSNLSMADSLILRWQFENLMSSSPNVSAGTAAAGSIGTNSSHLPFYNNKRIILTDTDGTEKTFLFDTSNAEGSTGTVDGSGNIVVQINGAADASAIGLQLTNAINSVSALAITAAHFGEGANLTQNTAGTAGNTTIQDPDSISGLNVTSFTGGTAGTTDYILNVFDFSSGSASSIVGDPVTGYNHPGLAINMPATSSAIFQEFIPGVRYSGIDNSYTSNRVKVKNAELDKFTPGQRPVTYNYLFEKSMFQVASEEMVNFFAGVVGYNNLIGQPVDKYRAEYKLLEKMRQRFFEKVQRDMDLDKFVEYYKWIDSALSSFLKQLIPASSFLGEDIKDVVESHILERNKYQHRAPTVEFKDPADKTFPILGVNELLYDWEHGHAPISGDEEENCLWHKERSEVSSNRQVIKRIYTTEVSGSTYVRRALTKPYKVSGKNVNNVTTGFNRKANKLHGASTNAVTAKNNIVLAAANIQEQPVCKDVIDPSALKTYRGQTDVTNHAGYLDGDSDLLFPFTLVSSSAGTDFALFKKNLKIANNHLDLDITGERSLKSPFTDAHAGGMPHRNVAFRTADAERPEAYALTATATALTMSQTPINKPKSTFFRGVSGTRFMNISNIKHGTSSLVLGNHSKDYEVVMTSGRSTNNNYFIDQEGSFLGTSAATATTILSPAVVDFTIPNRGKTEHVIVNRFSAPGSSETNGAYGRDQESEEFSIYNTINYRNLVVRDAWDQLSTEVADRTGLRPASTIQSSPHKTNRNPTRLTGSTKQTKFDNFFIQRPLPTNDFGYSWITASVNEDVYSFLSKNQNMGHQSSFSVSDIRTSAETISFLIQSEGGIGSITNLDFAGMNIRATSSLDTVNNILSYTDTDLNSQILNKQGPYGWPTWKQLRGHEHPVTRFEKRNNKFSIVLKREPSGNDYPFPQSYNSYAYNSNPNLISPENKSFETSETFLESFNETMATNRFNPLTITFHSSRALDATTSPISQARHEGHWTSDETSLTSYGENAQNASNAQDAANAQGPGTRLASLKITLGNGVTMFSNEKLTNKLNLDDKIMKEDVDSLLNSISELSNEDDEIYATETNYIETIYPREINTFSKESRVRELFDFFGWRKENSNRILTLTGSNSYDVVSFAISTGSGTVYEILPKITESRTEDKLSNGFYVDAVDISTVQSGSGDITLRHIKSSRWPLDARETFTTKPLSLTASYFLDGNSFFASKDAGTRGEGTFQNDYSIFALGYNGLHGTPPPAMLYNRRIPQEHGTYEYLAGEAQWKTADQAGVYPFENDHATHIENLRQLGQDHSLVPEFLISDHVEEILSNQGGDFNKVREQENYLSVTGAVYHTSSQTLEVSKNFYKTYGTSDMLKYFGMVVEKTKAADLGEPYKLTLRCKAAMKFTPYRGFYPAERVKQIGDLFSRGYMPSFNYQESTTTVANADINDAEEALKRKIRANLQQSMKPLFSPGVLMNSIKTGMAVDYPLFSADNFGVQEINGIMTSSAERASSSQFGFAISSNDNYLAVSQPGAGMKVFLYKRVGDEWNHSVTLTGSGVTADRIGKTLHMSEDSLVVSTNYNRPNTYVYVSNSSGWDVENMLTLTASNATSAAKEKLGGSSTKDMSISKNELFIGAWGSGSADGAVYHFRRTADGWPHKETYILSASDGAGTTDNFGYSLDSIPGYLAVGAPVTQGSFVDSQNYEVGGAVYIFTGSESGFGEYGQYQKISPTSFQQGMMFGYSVAMSGSYLAVGARSATAGEVRQAGAVFIYKKNDSNIYKAVQEIRSPVIIEDHYFGSSVRMSGSLLAVAAALVNQQSAAYAYKLNDQGFFDFISQPGKDFSDAGEANSMAAYNGLEITKDDIIVGKIPHDVDGATSNAGAIFFHKIIEDAVKEHNINKRTVVFPTSSFHIDHRANNTFTGSIVNNTIDGGIPRLSGSVYKRVSFEDILEPERLLGLKIEDQEPHPSASLYYGDHISGRVLEYPFTFGKLDNDSNEIDLGVSSFSLRENLGSSLKPYRLAINNFCAETVNFFLKDSKLATIESLPVNPNLLSGVEYKMRVHVRNNNTKMYDRHSAFGPPVDEGDVYLRSGDNSVKFEAQHAHSPFVAPFLDPGSEPYVEITFTPEESRTHTLEEILQGSKYNYVNFSNAIADPETNVNYINAMSISASLDLRGLVAYEPLENIDPGTTLEQRQRWVIQPKWETPVLNFIDSTGSALDLNDSVTREVTGAVSPWQKRQWSNFYNTRPELSSSIQYMTSSIGMWHQLGRLPNSDLEGYSISIEPVPDIAEEQQLAEKVGFIKNSSISVKAGQVADIKVVSEAVIAIPFIEPESSDGDIKYFNISRDMIAKATGLNQTKHDEYIEKVKGKEPSSQAFRGITGQYDAFFNTPGQTPVQNVAYQLRMSEKFVVPPQFEGMMQYVFQFNAEFNKGDLANIWQNIAPTSDLSAARLKYSSVKKGSGAKSQDIQYVSNFLLPTMRPHIDFMDFENSKIRWMIIKAKQRAEFDLNVVKMNSLPGVERKRPIDTSVGSIRPTKELINQDYSFNWPYDFFSIVELVKIEGKVDVFKGLDPLDVSEE